MMTRDERSTVDQPPHGPGPAPIGRWGNAAMSLLFGGGQDGPVLLTGMASGEKSHDTAALATSAALGPAALGLVQVELTGAGRSGTSGKRHVDALVSQRLRYVGHDETTDGPRRCLSIRMLDPSTGLRVSANYETYDQLPVVRCWAELTAQHEVVVEHVSSFVFSGLASCLAAPDWGRDLVLWTAANPWGGELRWAGTPLSELGLLDVGMTRYGQAGSKNRVALTSTGSWPSSEYLPMGWLQAPGGVLAWQIEHNGSWHTELGDRHGEVYILLSGPSHREHQWSVRLAPGESFASVPVALTLTANRDDALDALTRYRRVIRLPHPDNTRLPVVFNDFMNCLMGAPTTQRLLPLVTAAAHAGAEYFCVDAGWFDDEPDRPAGTGQVPGWWDAVGTWEPSAWRFPGGLAEVTDAIKAAGMVAGLWLEPEVVGVRSPVAATLPDEAFFRRDGRRVVEWGRYQLDLRHPAAVAHLDAAVDRLVHEFGIGYLKFDYNIDIGAGTGEPAGGGLLGHNRAYLRWLEHVLDRHPDLVVEGCAAGGMRLDHATLSRVAIQSITDQQDDRLIAAIAAAAPTAVPPEQGAIWAYPQPEFTAERIAFTMISAMLGRIHLSGRLDLLDQEQLGLVAQAVTTYKSYRAALATGIPRWPLGLPRWDAGWLALAIDCGAETYLAVWRRESPSSTCDVPLPWMSDAQVRLVFPAQGDGEWRLDSADALLRVSLPVSGTARLFRIAAPSSSGECPASSMTYR